MWSWQVDRAEVTQTEAWTLPSGRNVTMLHWRRGGRDCDLNRESSHPVPPGELFTPAAPRDFPFR